MSRAQSPEPSEVPALPVPRSRGRILPPLGIGLTLLGGLWAAAACAPSQAGPEPAAEEERRAPVRTVLAASREVQDVARLAADLSPLRRALLAAEVPGSVDSLHAEQGDRVRPGQVLARIDTRSLEQGLAEAEALHRRAQARHERASRLFERRSITQQQLLDAVTDRDVAIARLAGARLQLEKSAVRAPWSGEVARRLVEVGDYVAPGTPVMEILDVSRLKVQAVAAAADVPYLEVGATVFLHLESLEAEPFEGHIVRLAAELDPATRTLEIEAEIPNGEGRLKPGLYGSLEVVRRTIPEAVTVPLQALVDLGGREAVFVVLDGRAQRREIELGPVVGQQVVVRRGLAAGERVVVEGQQGLGQGQPVTEEGVPAAPPRTP